MSEQKVIFQSLTQSELADLLLGQSRIRRSQAEGLSDEEIEKKKRKQAALRAKLIFHWVYQRYVTDFDQMSDIAKELREWLKTNICIHRMTSRVVKQAEDGTHKFLWELSDGKTIESVIIPSALHEKDEIPEEGQGRFAGIHSEERLDSEHWSRLTVCISSQVGCAMACKFCLTGIQGLDRHLQVHEIVTQVHELRMRAPITNIVFMGMGEPLHNLDNVAKACQILLDQDGMNFSKRKVTVSTSGIAPAIEELGKRVDVSLAISLNGSNDEQRSMIMPVNRKWNISRLLEACRKYPLGAHRRITFEYVLLKGMNDSLEDAARVLQLLKSMRAKVNLIPFNEHPGSEFKRPSDQTVRAFQRYLLDRGMTATVRISRGRDILAACGQLRSIFGTARGTEKHRDYVLSSPGLTTTDALTASPSPEPLSSTPSL